MCPNDGVSHVPQPNTIRLRRHTSGKLDEGDIIVELNNFYTPNPTEDYTLPKWCLRTAMYAFEDKNIADFDILYDDILRHS